jgi:hypothetical protein
VEWLLCVMALGVLVLLAYCVRYSLTHSTHLNEDEAKRRAQLEAVRLWYLEHMHTLSGTRFEEFCGEVFASLGYSVTMTQASHDGGIDLELLKDGCLTLVQCKRSGYPVGVKPVRELLGVVSKRAADKGILATNSTFTIEAEQFVFGQRLELIDGAMLARVASRLWRPRPRQSSQESTLKTADTESRPLGTSTPSPETTSAVVAPIVGQIAGDASRTARGASAEGQGVGPAPPASGDRVRHEYFGPGVVASVDGKYAAVQFDAPHGLKKLDLSIAPLESDEAP